MDKDKYIKDGLLSLTSSSINALLPYGAFFLLIMCGLDYFVTPENFPTFFVYRLIASSSVMVLYLIYKLKKTKDSRFLEFTVITATLIPSIMVESMILPFGGHQSIYYTGMIIVIIFILGFLLIPFRLCVIVAGLVYAIYLIPVLLLDTITNIRIFINSNMFLLASIFGALGWRYFNLKLIVKNLSLEYDLTQDKEQLEIYSNKLEHLVEERTKELTISEQKYRALFDNANDGVVVFDKNGIIVNVNQKFCELHGFERGALIGTNIKLIEVEDPTGEKQERVDRILGGEALLFETEHYRKDGNRILLEVSSKSIDIGGELYIQSFHRDTSEKKRLQEQLFQSQKMESIGILVGGIAHDFNNILTAILGHAELLNEYGDLDPTGKQRVKIIETSARKAGQMISKLLSFSRKSKMETVPVSLNNVIRDTVDLLERMLSKKNIDIKFEAYPDLPLIDGDSSQMEQVIMNLVINASDVMPAGGSIMIATSAADLQNNVSVVHPLLSPGKYVVLKISDTGTGIPAEISSKIFDPFFTTKETGKGTGLGLSMVYGIVKEHKGVINVDSQLGKGTTFEIYLPASKKIFRAIDKSYTDLTAGHEKILVVDDEEDILSFIRDILERKGYKVLATNSPVYALDLFRKISDEIDLVITDIIMPLVNGRELISHFKSIKPDIRIMAISGYDAGKIGEKDSDIDVFIRKPFESVYLLSVVRKILDSRLSRG